MKAGAVQQRVEADEARLWHHRSGASRLNPVLCGRMLTRPSDDRREKRVVLAALVVALLISCRTEESVAPGFTEEKFLALPVGVSQRDVVAVLGEPLERWNHWNSRGAWDAAYWSYRKRTSAGAEHHAVLVFTPDGRLTNRDLNWYVD